MSVTGPRVREIVSQAATKALDYCFGTCNTCRSIRFIHVLYHIICIRAARILNLVFSHINDSFSSVKSLLNCYPSLDTKSTGKLLLPFSVSPSEALHDDRTQHLCVSGACDSVDTRVSSIVVIYSNYQALPWVPTAFGDQHAL